MVLNVFHQVSFTVVASLVGSCQIPHAQRNTIDLHLRGTKGASLGGFRLAFVTGGLDVEQKIDYTVRSNRSLHHGTIKTEGGVNSSAQHSH